MSGIAYRELTDPAEKHHICGAILRSLPDWFGIERSIVEYAEKARDQRMYAAFRGPEAAGFVTLERHNPNTFEVYCMGVRREYHRGGIGRALVEWCEKEARAEGAKFLTVKTLAATRPDSHYEKTRKFYEAMGFVPLEIFSALWGKENPCLFLAKPL